MLLIFILGIAATLIFASACVILLAFFSSSDDPWDTDDFVAGKSGVKLN
jgi:hypothetical protein